MRKDNVNWITLLLLLLVLSLVILGGCGKTIHPVNLVVHSDPQGGHVLYKAPLTNDQWIYLGTTPVKTVQMVDDELTTTNHKYILRILRDGFHEQIKEWDGEAFIETYNDQGKIFWTPHLIQSKP